MPQSVVSVDSEAYRVCGGVGRIRTVILPFDHTAESSHSLRGADDYCEAILAHLPAGAELESRYADGRLETKTETARSYWILRLTLEE